ncbi:MAG: hypothetical protein WA676_13560 [Candidatus Sulfotelmatobacter sp.]
MPIVAGISLALIGLWVFIKADAIAAKQKQGYRKRPVLYGLLGRMVLYPWYPTYLRGMAVLSWFVAALAILVSLFPK